MNRVVIGFLAVLVLLIIVVFGAKRLPRFNIAQIFRQASPKPKASVNIFALPSPSLSPSPSALPYNSSYPSNSSSTVLPKSGILPATGL